MSRTYVGFGFGPIQSGLFICEAVRSGQFSRYVIVDVDADLVHAIRNHHGLCYINIAMQDHIEPMPIGPVEIYHPGVPEDRKKIIEAISESQEIGTALPNVRLFESGGCNSVSALLAEGIRNSANQKVIYTAENNNHAAEILEKGVLQAGGSNNDLLARVQFLNTVIGKMSGVISDPEEIRSRHLRPLVDGFSRAILVESFNHILISQITLPSFKRGITAFVEKRDLLPFEEAKLYGHNAIHALIGYLASLRGYTTMPQAMNDKAILSIAHGAFIEESGVALVHKYQDLHDALFTSDGFREYAQQLLIRMGNPYLNDAVERVTRDPQRKLSYDDRLIGAMRMAYRYGITPDALAQGAAAALVMLYRQINTGHQYPQPADIAHLLHDIWADTPDDGYKERISLLISNYSMRQK